MRVWHPGGTYELPDGRRFILLSLDVVHDRVRVTWHGGLHEDVDIEDVRDAVLLERRSAAPLGGVAMDWDMYDLGGEG